MSIYQLKTFADLVAAIREEMGIQSTDTTSINRIKRNINEVYADIVARKRWKWLNASAELTLPAYFNSGTVAVNQYSNVVTLTIAPASSKAGYFLALDGYNEIYRIESHTAGSTTVRLATEFTGSTQSGASFRIWTDRLALPTDCKETVEVWHDTYRQGLENVGRQEFRRIQRLSPRNEGKPQCYFTGDYVDPAPTSSIASLPSVATRSSALQRKTIVFSGSLPTAVVTAVNAGEPVRWRIAGAGHPSYNGDVYVSAVSTTSNSNDTITYSAPIEYTEAAIADSGMTVTQVDAEQDYDRYRELFLHPSLNNTKTTIHIEFTREAQPLNNDADEPLIPLQDRSVLKYGALHLSWSRARNPEEAARNLQLFENKIGQMEGKWEDALETARLSPSRNYLAAKRNTMRKRLTNGEFGPLSAGGSAGAQVISGTPNRLAGYDANGVLTATAATFSQISALTSLTNAHVYVGNASNAAADVALSGDASLANTGALTVNSVGGSTAANIHAAEALANAATNSNTASTIVKRDGSGNFSAGTITASLTGNVTGNASGTAANVTGTVAIANGGTGQTAKAAAFDALQPMTTSGDIIYGGASGTGTRLAKGTDGQFLKLASGIPSWAGLPTSTTPTIQKFTSGTGTYTTPANVAWIRVRMVGGGGGGCGSSDSSGDAGAGGSGGNTTFGTTLLTANGGAGGSGSGGGAGGSVTINSPAVDVSSRAGAAGTGGGQVLVGSSNAIAGAPGGVTPFAGGGAGGKQASVGGAAVANTGSGGGSAGTPAQGATGGAGGAGGYIEAIISAPSATYSYAIGSLGTAGTAGTSGFAGGAGALGVIIVEEHY